MGRGYRASGSGECTICSHPGVTEINAMILNGTNYQDIIDRMKALHPSVTVLQKSSLTRHKQRHLLNQPITTTEVSADGTSIEKTTYITGVIRSESLTLPREMLPTPGQVSLEEALDVIILAGTMNVLNNPGMVGTKALIDALTLKEKMGDTEGARAEFEKAWTDPEYIAKKKKLKEAVKSKRKVTRSVTFAEEMEDTPPEGTVVEGEVHYQLEDNNGDFEDELAGASIPNAATAARVRVERSADL